MALESRFNPPMDLEDSADSYLGWLEVEANKSPLTVEAFTREIRRFIGFLEATGHSLQLEALCQADLRAFQFHLAMVPGQGKRGQRLSPATRARALVAIRSWLRWLAREGLIDRDLWSRITVPKVPERLPKPIDPYELPHLLAGLPKTDERELRDRALELWWKGRRQAVRLWRGAILVGLCSRCGPGRRLA